MYFEHSLYAITLMNSRHSAWMSKLRTNVWSSKSLIKDYLDSATAMLNISLELHLWVPSSLHIGDHFGSVSCMWLSMLHTHCFSLSMTSCYFNGRIWFPWQQHLFAVWCKLLEFLLVGAKQTCNMLLIGKVGDSTAALVLFIYKNESAPNFWNWFLKCWIIHVFPRSYWKSFWALHSGVIQIIAQMRSSLHCLFADLHKLPGTQYSVDPGFWPITVSCLTDALIFPADQQGQLYRRVVNWFLICRMFIQLAWLKSFFAAWPPVEVAPQSHLLTSSQIFHQGSFVLSHLLETALAALLSVPSPHLAVCEAARCLRLSSILKTLAARLPSSQPPRTTLPWMHFASVLKSSPSWSSRPPQGTFRFHELLPNEDASQCQ